MITVNKNIVVVIVTLKVHKKNQYYSSIAAAK